MLFQRIVNQIKKLNDFLLIICIPLVASILPILVPGKEAKCGFVLVVMALYWILECLPIGVTGLIPALVFPLFDIASAKEIAPFYFQEMVFFMLGSLITSDALKASGLHERIALLSFLIFGSNPKNVLFGMMCLTAFISMWVPNAAAVSVMLPIANSIIDQLSIHEQIISSNLTDNESFISVQTVSSISLIEKEVNSNKDQDKFISMPEKTRRLGASFLLSCTYSAAFGGLCTLVGSSVNIYFKGFMEENYPHFNVGFLNFSLFAFPIGLSLLIFTWALLSFRYLPKQNWFDRESEELELLKKDLNQIVRNKYNNLGQMSYEQKSVGIVFMLLAVLWLTRDLPHVGGWQSLFHSKYISDSLPSILVIILLFILPKKNIFKGENYEHLLDLNELETALSWNITLMMGGGFSLAKGFEISGLSNVILDVFKSISIGNKQTLLLILMIFGSVGTEFISSVSMAAIYFPLIDHLATASEISSIYFLVPVSFAISFSYMFAVSSAKNAIIFTGGYVKVKDMLTTGLIIKIFGLAVVYLAANTWLGPVFRLNNTNTNATIDTTNKTLSLIFNC